MKALHPGIWEVLQLVIGSLRNKQELKVKDNQFPILEVSPIGKSGSTEILMWAIAILASSWTQWCFTAKTKNPTYQNDPKYPEASQDVLTALPYVRASIIDSISRGEEIGCTDTSILTKLIVLSPCLY